MILLVSPFRYGNIAGNYRYSRITTPVLYQYGSLTICSLVVSLRTPIIRVVMYCLSLYWSRSQREKKREIKERKERGRGKEK